MKQQFNLSFKQQAVEKALNRGGDTSFRSVAKSLGIGNSTLNNWIFKARNQQLVGCSKATISTVSGAPLERRPQDWAMPER